MVRGQIKQKITFPNSSEPGGSMVGCFWEFGCLVGPLRVLVFDRGLCLVVDEMGYMTGHFAILVPCRVGLVKRNRVHY